MNTIEENMNIIEEIAKKYDIPWSLGSPKGQRENIIDALNEYSKVINSENNTIPKPYYIKLIPLDATDIPINSWIKENGNPTTRSSAIIGIDHHGVRVIQVGSNKPEWITYEQLREYYTIQRPDGKGWVKAEKPESNINEFQPCLNNSCFTI